MTRLAKCVKRVPVTTLAFALVVYGFDCPGTATPEQAMQCCKRMHCHSHHHNTHKGSRECCNDTTQLQVALGQPSSIHAIAVTPATMPTAHVFNDSRVAKYLTHNIARHSHDPPDSYATLVISLRI